MLVSEQLDRESFEEIFKGAVSEIIKIYPAWTNYNSSETGVALAELLAWLVENQRYHLNRIGEAHCLRYLKLLGTSPRSSAPSRTYLKVTGGGIIPENTIYFADDIPFETEREFTARSGGILCFRSGSEALENRENMLEEFSGNTAFYPFGKSAPYSSFEIELTEPFGESGALNIFFMVRAPFQDAEAAEDYISLVTLRAEADGNELIILGDETKGFYKSGIISLEISSEAAGSRSVILSVSSGEFAETPVICGAAVNVVSALQKRTLSRVAEFDADENGSIKTSFIPDEIYAVDGERRIKIDDFSADGRELSVGSRMRLEAVKLAPDFRDMRLIGSANGACNYVLKLDLSGILEESLALYVKESGGFYRWERVMCFDRADKFSRCYVYNAGSGEFVFGNGEKGMPPHGEIYLFGCEISLNARGNIKAGMVDSYDEATGSRAKNILPSVGGRTAQSVDECFGSLRTEYSAPLCCVTTEDFERAVRKTCGASIKRVKAFLSGEKPNCVCIAAETKTGGEKLNGGILKNLRKNILPRVMLGTKVEFFAPQYAALHIFAEIVPRSRRGECGSLAERAFREYFDGGGINFGDVIRIHNLIGFICRLPWVGKVKSLEISVSGGSGERLPNGDIKLKSICLPFVDKVTVSVCSQ